MDSRTQLWNQVQTIWACKVHVARQIAVLCGVSAESIRTSGLHRPHKEEAFFALLAQLRRSHGTAKTDCR